MDSSISQDLSFLKDHMPSASDDEVTRFRAAQQLKFSAFREESQDITLFTEEGDKVTISSLSQFQSDYMAFDYAAKVKDDSVKMHTEEMNTSIKDSFSMAVEGDLNEAELADIQKVLGELDDIMNNLVKGDLDAVMKDALGVIDGADTITGLDATLQFEQRVEMERRVVREMTGPGPAHGRGHMPPPPDAAALAQNGHDMFQKFVAKITDQITKIFEEASVKPEELKGPVDEMFERMLGKVSSDAPDADMKNKLLDQLQANTQAILNPEE